MAANFAYATAADGTSLESIFFQPSKAISKPWKTVVIVHAGPMDRVTLSFSHEATFHLGPWLATAGYAVLFPNYRGSNGRGEKFTSAARDGAGTLDYDDIITVIKAGIRELLIDEAHVAIGGWSAGGILSYLATVRPFSFDFRAAVCGAGITDWDSSAMTSDYPALEAELVGGAPWDRKPDDVSTRRISPIWHIPKIEMPILILHGEKDERIPLSQGTAFYRGCLHHKKECQMVVYPREPHMIAERAHVIDMLERIKAFYDKHMDM